MIVPSPREMCERRAARRARPGGFTMVELLFAVGILVVAFLGVITVVMTGHTDISQSGRDTVASAAAQSLGENMRNQPSTDWTTLNGMTTGNPSACPGATGTRLNNLCQNFINDVANLPEGLGTVTITQTPNPGTGINFYRATIAVGWTEAGRGARQRTLVVGRSD